MGEKGLKKDSENLLALTRIFFFFQNHGSNFNPNPLAGLNGSSDEEPEELPALNRIKKDKNPPKDNVGRKLRLRRQRPDPESYPRERVWANVDPRPFYQPETRPDYDPFQRIVDSPIFRGQVEAKKSRHRRDEDNEEAFSSGIQFRAYGGEAGTGRSAGPEPRRTPAPKKSGPPPTQRPPELAPQIDENFVSTLFKHPEAVKIVFDYLEKEKALTSTTTTTTPKPTTKTTTTKRTTTTTTTKAPRSKAPKPSVTPPPKPISANQAKINRLNSLFGLALLATENNNNNNGQRPEGQPDKQPDRNKRPEKVPSLASFFGQVEKSDIKKKSEIPSLSSIFSAIEKLPQRPEKVENPLVTGEKKPDLQFFGPSDFVPKAKYSLPVHTNGPMKLKYVSAKDFPFNTPFGIVPIPR